MTATNYEDSEDRTLPTVVYALYLLGLINGLTVIIGVIIAYANRDRASPWAMVRVAIHRAALLRL